MPERLRDLLGASSAALFGLVAFLVFAGWWVLLPQNIAWLAVRDQAMHTLGWMAFRDSPWSLPPGASPRLGIELANSIGLVDGLPLFALPFKALSPLLPQPFQYWGLWWLLCFVLQALFGYRLARELGAGRPVAVLAGAFAVVTPAFLFRLTQHMALAGHWILLAGLALYAQKRAPKTWAWPLLVALAAAIHPYLFVMVGALWAAALVQRLWLGALDLRGAAAETLLGLAAGLATLWAVGVFYTGTLGGAGFGFFRLNLLGPLISQGWSRLVPSLPHSDYDYEGLSFLGIGVLFALALALLTGALAELGKLATRRWLPLIILCVLCVLCALSNVVGVLDRQAPPIPLPAPLEHLGAMFRASGRFVWPALYFASIGAIILAARRLRPGLALPLIALFLVVQIVDSQWNWSALRCTMPAPAATWQTPLVSPFWARAAETQTRLRAIPVKFKNPDWQWLGYYAITHGMDIDAVYLGRVDRAAVARLAAAEDVAIATGDFEAETLYIVSRKVAQRLAPGLRQDDLLAKIDGRLVFVAGGARLVDGLGIDPRSALAATAWLPGQFQVLFAD